MARKWFMFVEARQNGYYQQIIGCLGGRNELHEIAALDLTGVPFALVEAFVREAKPGDFFHPKKHFYPAKRGWTLFCINAEQPTQLPKDQQKQAIMDEAEERFKTYPKGTYRSYQQAVNEAAKDLAADGIVRPGFNPLSCDWRDER